MNLTDRDKKSIEEKGGYYRSVKGRVVFIKVDQSVSDALKTAAAAEERTAALNKVKDRIRKKRFENAFRQQLQQVQDGTFDKNSHLQLGETPGILVEKAGIPKLPLMMPYTKAYLSINSSGSIAGNYHSLGVGTLSQLPTALHSPKYIFQHDNPKKIEVVVELKDKHGKNILASIEFDTLGRAPGSEHVPANVVVTAFAPRGSNYIELRKNSGKLIYEKKS